MSAIVISALTGGLRAQKIADEEESLRGITAMSVAVITEGTKDVSEAELRRRIEDALRTSGIKVLPEGYPKLVLKLDALFRKEGFMRGGSTVYTMSLEVVQALSAGGRTIAATTWRTGSFGIRNALETASLMKDGQQLTDQFLGEFAGVNPGLSAQVTVKSEVWFSSNYRGMGPLENVPQGQRDIVARQLAGIWAAKQQMISCTYGPQNPDGTGFSTIEFWYKQPPSNIRDLLSVARGTHPLRTLGAEAIDACPATRQLAMTLKRRSIVAADR